jgi:hypothetical protein
MRETRTMSRYSSWTKIGALLGAAVLGGLMSGHLYAAELTPETYCQLAIQSMQLQL